MNLGQLVMRDCVVEHNQVVPQLGKPARAGGIASSSTSEISTDAQLTLVRSAVVENQAPAIGGVELAYASVALIEDSTISGNSDVQLSALETNTFLTNATLVGAGPKPTLDVAGTLFMISFTHTAVVGAPGCTFSSTAPPIRLFDGVNASSDATCGFVRPDDVSSTPLGLSPLATTGGSPGHTPLPGSPLIDRITTDSCNPLDQRGNPRPEDGDGDGWADCDIGAVEVPEPGFAAALAAGALGLAGRARRRRPSSGVARRETQRAWTRALPSARGSRCG